MIKPGDSTVNLTQEQYQESMRKASAAGADCSREPTGYISAKFLEVRKTPRGLFEVEGHDRNYHGLNAIGYKVGGWALAIAMLPAVALAACVSRGADLYYFIKDKSKKDLQLLSDKVRENGVVDLEGNLQ